MRWKSLCFIFLVECGLNWWTSGKKNLSYFLLEGSSTLLNKLSTSCQAVKKLRICMAPRFTSLTLVHGTLLHCFLSWNPRSSSRRLSPGQGFKSILRFFSVARLFLLFYSFTWLESVAEFATSNWGTWLTTAWTFLCIPQVTLWRHK